MPDGLTTYWAFIFFCTLVKSLPSFLTSLEADASNIIVGGKQNVRQAAVTMVAEVYPNFE